MSLLSLLFPKKPAITIVRGKHDDEGPLAFPEHFARQVARVYCEEQAMPHDPFDMSSIKAFIDEINTLRVFKNDPDYNNTPAVHLKLDVGTGPLVVITGENASGKSFFRKIVSQAHQMSDAECMHLSQQGRATGGIQRAFIYGSEDDESTGYISSQTVSRAIRTSLARTTKHSIFFDEPDIGLSDNYAASLGKQIADYCQAPSPHLFAVFVSSHNKTLMSEFVASNPHHLRVGGSPDFQTWLNTKPSYGDLDQLHERGIELFRRIGKVLGKK